MSRDSFLKRVKGHDNLTPSHRRAPKQEKEIAARVGGRITPGSGSKFLKGDIRKKRVVRIEAKTTKHASFSVTLEMVRKIQDAALAFDEMPIIVVEFNDNGKRIAELAVCPTYVLDSLGYEDDRKT